MQWQLPNEDKTRCHVNICENGDDEAISWKPLFSLRFTKFLGSLSPMRHNCRFLSLFAPYRIAPWTWIRRSSNDDFVVVVSIPFSVDYCLVYHPSLCVWHRSLTRLSVIQQINNYTILFLFVSIYSINLECVWLVSVYFLSFCPFHFFFHLWMKDNINSRNEGTQLLCVCSAQSEK